MKGTKRLVQGLVLTALALGLSAWLAGEQQVTRKDFPAAGGRFWSRAKRSMVERRLKRFSRKTASRARSTDCR